MGSGYVILPSRAELRSLTQRSATVDDLLALVKEYFERFGTKACSFDDLHPYLQVLSDEETRALREVLVEASEDSLKVCCRASPYGPETDSSDVADCCGRYEGHERLQDSAVPFGRVYGSGAGKGRGGEASQALLRRLAAWFVSFSLLFGVAINLLTKFDRQRSTAYGTAAGGRLCAPCWPSLRLGLPPLS